jgi:spore coat polysaccharide biosynthesis protein SpsF
MAFPERRPRVVASIEARMGSSRFPGKMLSDLCGRPALSWLARRARRARSFDAIVLATSTASADDALERWAAAEGLVCYRGSEDDVLQRVVEAHRFMRSDLVVEITGDSIITDPEILDWGVDTFLQNDCDIVTNVRPGSFPMGIDIQVYPLSLLEEVERTVHDPAAREHVTLHFYEHPERYRILNLSAPRRWHAPEFRFQLDYHEDHRFLTEVIRRLQPIHGDAFGLEEVMALLRREPDLLQINAACMEKAVR